MQVFNALKFKRLSKNPERRFLQGWLPAVVGLPAFESEPSSPCERRDLPKIKKAAITDCFLSVPFSGLSSNEMIEDLRFMLENNQQSWKCVVTPFY